MMIRVLAVLGFVFVGVVVGFFLALFMMAAGVALDKIDKERKKTEQNNIEQTNTERDGAE